MKPTNQPTRRCNQPTSQPTNHLVQLVLDKTVHLLEPDTDGVVHRIWVNHGFGGLDKLLAAADWLGMAGCVSQVVAEACKHAALIGPTASTDSDELVYNQLAALPRFPPVGTEWPGMGQLLRLCRAMPAILDYRLGMLFFNKLCHKVDVLYQLPGQRLTTIPGDLSQTCVYDADAMAGTDRFVVVQCADEQLLVKLRAGQASRRECSPDQLGEFAVLARRARIQTAQPVQPVQPVQPAQTAQPAQPAQPAKPCLPAVSPDNKHLLWNDPHGVFKVVDLETGRPVELSTAFDEAAFVNWAGPSVLSVCVGHSSGCLLVDLAHLSSVDRLFEPCRGSAALQSKACTISVFRQTLEGSALTLQDRSAADRRSMWLQLDFELHQWWEDTTDSSGQSFVLLGKQQYYSLKVDFASKAATARPIPANQAAKKLAKVVWSQANTTK
jgi:hypothetical protein